MSVSMDKSTVHRVVHCMQSLSVSMVRTMGQQQSFDATYRQCSQTDRAADVPPPVGRETWDAKLTITMGQQSFEATYSRLRVELESLCIPREDFVRICEQSTLEAPLVPTEGKWQSQYRKCLARDSRRSRGMLGCHSTNDRTALPQALVKTLFLP
jgi:hypothetical protein